MSARLYSLMNTVAVPVVAVSFALVPAGSAAFAQDGIENGAGSAAARIRIAQATIDKGRNSSHKKKKVTKGDQQYLGSASRIKDRPRPGPEKIIEITAPDDPVAARAFKVFDKHCARCHQVGRLVKRDKPDKDFGNILKLDEIARNASLILPGNADGSPLFVQMVNRQMPYDVFKQGSGGAEPTSDDLDAVRDWIDSLGSSEKTTASVCGAHGSVDQASVAASIAGDIEREDASRRRGLRYITLTHLYNSCTDDNELAAYRQAVVKLLNSLSGNTEILKLQTVGDSQTVIKFHLDDLKWSEGDWNRILAAYPYALKAEGARAATVQQETGTPLAWIRGDWLAYTASRPPLYQDLLKLAKSETGLQEKLSQDTQANTDFQKSLRNAGLDPDINLNGVEIITALAKRYERNVDLKLAAAEFDVTETKLRDSLENTGIRAYWMKRRLEQGSVPRATFQRRFAALVKTVSGRELVDTSSLTAAPPPPVARVSEEKPADGSSFELTLFSDKSVYEQNDLAVFTVQSKKSCNLTLINVDNNGNGTVIYPNKYQQQNFLEANKVLKFPSDDAAFQFRLRDKGTESVIAVCNTTGKNTDGIRHDFKTRSFTSLGNYRKYLNRQIVIEGRAKSNSAQLRKDGSGGKQTMKEPSSAIVRTAVKFEVK